MPSRCAQLITRRLAGHGGWMGRPELTAGLGFGEPVLDDELADLVVAGTVLFNDRAREYRLGGTLWARRAVRDLVRSNTRRAVVMGQSPDKTLAMVGLARQVALAGAPEGETTLVMAEMALPYDGLAGALLVADHLQRWVTAEECAEVRAQVPAGQAVRA